MANRLYNQQVSPKGYKRGGGVTDQTKKSESKPKKKNIIQKLRKKFLPTFGEQAEKARKEGKKVFRSTRDKTKKGNLYYHSGTKEEAKKALKKESSREKALRKTGQRKQVGLTDFQAAYKTADKANKKVFTHKGKKYTTLKKGEKPDKIMPELSGKTSKKIKKFIG